MSLLNLAKYTVLSFSGTHGRQVEISLIENDLEIVTSHKYLGVIISCDTLVQKDDEQRSFDPTTSFPEIQALCASAAERCSRMGSGTGSIFKRFSCTPARLNGLQTWGTLI